MLGLKSVLGFVFSVRVKCKYMNRGLHVNHSLKISVSFRMDDGYG